MPGRTHVEVDALLRDAVDRQSHVELHFRQGSRPSVAMARFITMDDGAICISAPRNIDDDAEERLSEEQPLEAYFLVKGSRFRFGTIVLEARRYVPINDEKKVKAVVIRRPEQVHDGQRRAHFRVSVAGDEIPLEIHKANGDDAGSTPINAQPFYGSLINLSIGGAATRFEIQAPIKFETDDRFFITFRLPGEKAPFTFRAAVRQWRTIAEGKAVRMGLQIDPWPSPRALAREQQRIQRHITQIQRQQLKRAG